MTLLPQVDDATSFSKTVSESDIYLFAGMTGDLAPNHVDEEYMRGTAFGRRIAHGALLVGFMSTCSTRMAMLAESRGVRATAIALGYDRIRFLAPVYIGDTVRLRYTISDVDVPRARTRASVEVRNQAGELVAVAEHLIKWIPR